MELKNKYKIVSVLILIAASAVTVNFSFRNAVAATLCQEESSFAVYSPTDHSEVKGNNVVLAAISCNTPMSGPVRFTVDGKEVGTSNASGVYTVTWDSTTVADGEHTIGALGTSNGQTINADVITLIVKNKGAVDTTPPTTPPTTPAAVTNPCAPDSTSAQICNPLPDTDLKGLILRILQYLMGILGLVAVVIIVISGFRMVAGAGSEEQVKKAKTAITYAIVGLIISILAYSIVSIVQNVITKGK